MIGEAHDSLGKAASAEAGGKQPQEEQPGEELEKLEQGNEERIEVLEGIDPFPAPMPILLCVFLTLTGDDTVYRDLGMDAKNYPQVPTSWNVSWQV